MYQLYAYGTKYDNCEKIYLIYPFDELIIKNSYNYFKNKELKLDILFFDVYKKEFVNKNIELSTLYFIILQKLQLFKIIF